ncbi:MAG TPA: DUF2934 domain-containing protein [Acidisphaera sp.]|nr:DUF2934 domain-containing protein [Acidisphaera sp.]
MSDNPLELTPERERHIRERAYHLWEVDGRPHGRDLEYWERARELIGMEENPGSGLLPNPQTHHPINEVAPGVLAEEAAIQENLGEFPSAMMNDQGEWLETPAPKKARKQAETPVKETPIKETKSAAKETKAAAKESKAAAKESKAPAKEPAKAKATRGKGSQSVSRSG